MAGAPDNSLRRLGPWPLGVSNMVPETSRPSDDEGVELALRVADNVILDEAGKPSRREGYSKVLDLTEASGGFTDELLGLTLVVSNWQLIAIDDDYETTLLVDGLAHIKHPSFCRLHDSVAWTNGVQCGEVTQDLVSRPWGVAEPMAVPMATATAGGALDAGTYQLAVSHLDQWGRESGARAAGSVEVPDHGAIELQHLSPPAGGKTRVYVSDGHGGKLRAAVSTSATATTIMQRPKGRKCDTLFLSLMPPGQCVAYGNGRQYVARGRHVLFSPSLRYGLYDPRKSAVGFVKHVDLLAYVGDGTEAAGLYVADAKRTYFLAGADPANWTHRIVIADGADPGSLTWMPGDVWALPVKHDVPVWKTRKGRIAVGLPGGEVMYPQPTEGAPIAAMDRADRAALGFIESGGHRHLVASLKGAGPQTFTAQDQLTVRYYPAEGTP